MVNGGARFDGKGNYIKVAQKDLAPKTLEFTVVTWINGHKAQNWAAVVSARGMAKQAYWMGYRPDDILAYVWNNNSKGTWDWQGSIKIPQDTWALIAVAIEKTKATAYAHTESTKKLAIAENKIDHIDKFMFVASFYLLVFRIRSMKVSYLTKPHSWSIIISHLYWSNHS